MKVYIVLQEQYGEEDFGSLTEIPHIIHRVFTTKELAEEWIANQPEPSDFYAQFGNATESYYVEEKDLCDSIEAAIEPEKT